MTDAMFTTIWQSRELHTKKLQSKDLNSREHKKCVSFHRVSQPLPHHPLTIKRSNASTNLSNVNLLPLTSMESSDSQSSLESLETDTTLEKETSEGSATEPPGVLEKNYRFKDILQLPVGLGEEISESQDTVTSAGGEGNYTNDKDTPQPNLEETANSLDQFLTLRLPLEDEEEEEESSGPMKDEESSSTDTEFSENEDGNASIVTAPPAAKEPKYTQEIKVGPESLLPVEITHCLFELEEECKGVERISEDVKCKMLLIHSSTVSIQVGPIGSRDPLKTDKSSESAENPWRCGLMDRAVPSEDGKVHNLERMKERESQSPGAALREVSCISSLHPILRHASNTTLPVQALSVNWQRDSDDSMDMVSDLRASLEKLVYECAEERKERQETMLALGEFQNQFQAFMKQWESAQREQGRIANSLDELREETQNISTVAQSTLSVFSQLGQELEHLCAVGTRACNVSRQLPTAKQGEKELQ
ncbi:testis-specific serine kinase substrate-like [Polyodon spathula]|uniref:testis-specific serine kinase substrate-like n=1 Tax=Polyodon spathula TaxID=7913 RepID=UPI001B7F3443|nr:testis-specific serine kinase substrate-like [Polyodon spathula]